MLESALWIATTFADGGLTFTMETMPSFGPAVNWPGG
jgi:hypothetical protein